MERERETERERERDIWCAISGILHITEMPPNERVCEILRVLAEAPLLVHKKQEQRRRGRQFLHPDLVSAVLPM